MQLEIVIKFKGNKINLKIGREINNFNFYFPIFFSNFVFFKYLKHMYRFFFFFNEVSLDLFLLYLIKIKLYKSLFYNLCSCCKILEGQLPKGAAYLEENETEKRPTSDEKGIISPGEISEYIFHRFIVTL